MAICCLFHHPQQVCENACMAVRIVEYGLHLISPPLIELKVLVIIGKPMFTIGKLFPLKSNGCRFEMVTQCDCVNDCITLVLHMYLRCTHSTDIRYVNTVVVEMTKMANSISQIIQWTSDCPGGNEDGKMPSLDLKVWFSEEEGEQKIQFEFFRKPNSTRMLILA